MTRGLRKNLQKKHPVFTNVSNNINYLVETLIKQEKGLYDTIFKTLMTKLKKLLVHVKIPHALLNQ